MTRLIAFSLPQYHPVPENDLWWGVGFTEWTNVAKARPLFKGHYQPHTPADLGFYDLRVPETRAAQADLAREYGIEGFCYYHYWFAGRRILERPFSEVLQSGEPDFPFCLCWANQTWTGIWHGSPDKILIEQTYPGEEDHRAHFQALLPAFSDRRHITVDGKPLFLIYLPNELPETEKVVELWRTMAVKAGLKGLHLVAVLHRKKIWDPLQHGFDASVRQRFPILRRETAPSWRHPVKKLSHLYQEMTGKPTVHRYRDVLTELLPDSPSDPENYPCLLPNWDNTPRSGANGLVLHESTPELFRLQVRKAIRMAGDFAPQRRIVFIKSWNEWAEGNYLEPDHRFGRGYLEALRDELAGR